MSLVSGIGMDDRNMSETLLKRIPYVPKDSFAFIWSRRTLLSIRDKHLQDIDREWHADYMMYVCLDEDAGLARNKYLELVSGLHVYGDALLFKVKRGGLAKLDRAEYVNMDEGFGRDWRSVIGANNILGKLLDPQFQDKILVYFESKFAPKVYANPLYRQPYMKILTSVDAFRLPCDHSTEKNPICLANVTLVGMDTKAKGHKEVETRLRQVPDLRSYEGRKNFDWTRRKVVKVSYRKDDFVIYMCLDKDAKLPVNQSLKKWPKFSTPCCYGDAFIFKVHPGTGLKDTSSPAKYHHIGKDTTADCGQKGSLVLRILEEVFHEIRLIPEESSGRKS